MKRLTLVTFALMLSACDGVLRIQTGPLAPPPPPPPDPTLVVSVSAPAPPPPPADATADVAVETAPEVTTADPEEVTATTEPPDPVYEEQTDAPGPGYGWVPGYWGWTGADWAWYSGTWMMQPEGRIYIAPYYERVGPNVVYVNGYWGGRDAPRRSYGGEEIHFVAPPRPPDYRRGAPHPFERRAGLAPGARPARFYARATGTPRPMPHETMPRRIAARGGEPHGPMAANHEAPGHPGPEVGHPGPEAGHPGMDPGRQNQGMEPGHSEPPAGGSAAADKEKGPHEVDATGRDRAPTPEAHAAPAAAHPAPQIHTPAPKKKK